MNFEGTQFSPLHLSMFHFIKIGRYVCECFLLSYTNGSIVFIFFCTFLAYSSQRCFYETQF